jgi:hypothetical protein
MLPILEASEKLKMTPSAIRGKLNRGKLKGGKRIINGKEAWFVEVDEVEALPVANNWLEFEAQWHKAMNNGSVYGRPLSGNTQRIYKTGVSMFFELLGKAPDIELLTTENLLNALTNVQPNARGCRYTQKMHVYDGFRAIVRLLVAQNKASRLVLADATQFKPKRFTEAYQPFITGDVLEDLLHVANNWRMGKTYTDVKRLDVGIRLAGYMGLRRSEIVGLKQFGLKRYRTLPKSARKGA